LATAVKRVHLYVAVDFEVSERQMQMQKRKKKHSYCGRMLQESLGLMIAVKKVHLYAAISFEKSERQRQMEKREKRDTCCERMLQEPLDILYFQLPVLSFSEQKELISSGYLSSSTKQHTADHG
jgi:hypothetical protein